MSFLGAVEDYQAEILNMKGDREEIEKAGVAIGVVSDGVCKLLFFG